MTETAVEIPGYVAGTWTIDPVHSEVSFVVRHMMVSKVRGRFDKFEGTIVTAPDPLQSSVTATVDLSSVNTGEPNRDNHIRSADFFEVESHPTMTFRSTGVRPDGDNFLLDGDLTIRGTTRPVTLKLEVNGFGPDAYGGTRAGFSATTRDQPDGLGRQLQRPDPRRRRRRQREGHDHPRGRGRPEQGRVRMTRRGPADRRPDRRPALLFGSERTGRAPRLSRRCSAAGAVLDQVVEVERAQRLGHVALP